MCVCLDPVKNYVQDTVTSQGRLDDSKHEPAERSGLSIEISMPNEASHNITISIETTVRSDPDAKWSVGSPSNGSESAYALRYSTTQSTPAPANGDPAPPPAVTIRVDIPKQARDHTTSATNDKPTPQCTYKASTQWPAPDPGTAGLFTDTTEMIGEGHDKWHGEGHDKWHGNGWKDVESWIKIHPPSPAALGILTVGLLVKRTRPKKEKKEKNPSQRAQSVL